MEILKIKKKDFNKYKMLKISAEAYAKNYIHNILDKENNDMAKKQRYRRKIRC